FCFSCCADHPALHSFPTRRSSDLGELAPAAQPDYLSALLIGHEIAALAELLRHSGGQPRIVLCGDAELCQRYDAALRHYGLDARSEEHTSELQSRENLVCRLLLEK